MQKVLITGAVGFVGNYLIEHLKKQNLYEIYGTKLLFEKEQDNNINYLNLDIKNKEEVEKVISDVKPDIIFHLAAQSSVKMSWENPVETINININGTINLLESVKNNNPKCVILLIGSSEEYGTSIKGHDDIKEDTICMPENIYAISKYAIEHIGKTYHKAYGMNIIMTRSFNHIGPRQSSTFVVSDFCKQVALIEENQTLPKVIEVGNLEAYRDFTDVRDIVKAYTLLITKGIPGEIYNVGSGKSYQISSIITKILKNTDENIEVKVNQNKFRPIDIPKITANIDKLKNDTSWNQEYSIDETIKDTLGYWRQKVKEK